MSEEVFNRNYRFVDVGKVAAHSEFASRLRNYDHIPYPVRGLDTLENSIMLHSLNFSARGISRIIESERY